MKYGFIVYRRHINIESNISQIVLQWVRPILVGSFVLPSKCLWTDFSGIWFGEISEEIMNSQITKKTILIWIFYCL